MNRTWDAVSASSSRLARGRASPSHPARVSAPLPSCRCCSSPTHRGKLQHSIPPCLRSHHREPCSSDTLGACKQDGRELGWRNGQKTRLYFPQPSPVRARSAAALRRVQHNAHLSTSLLPPAGTRDKRAPRDDNKLSPQVRLSGMCPLPHVD